MYVRRNGWTFETGFVRLTLWYRNLTNILDFIQYDTPCGLNNGHNKYHGGRQSTIL